MIEVIKTIHEMNQWCNVERQKSNRIGLVPTMGALHRGHLSLVERARRYGNSVVVSIFVNPTQFGPKEDFNKYLRNINNDITLLENEHVQAVFAPDTDEMYQDGCSSYVIVEKLTDVLCGLSRPTHFRGVTTVVAKLFNIIKPNIAVFGQKDAQQLAVIRQMNRDLNFGVDIISSPIIRESDGLAMSSRNNYLSSEERKQAAVIYASLVSAETSVNTGETQSVKIIDTVKKELSTSALAESEYIEIVHPVYLTPLESVAEGALLAVAVKFGSIRLIDNILLKN